MRKSKYTLMNLRRLQTATFLLAGLLIPLSFIGERLSAWRFADVAFLATVYAIVVAGVISTIIRYRREQHDSLPNWRRIPYASGLFLLVTFCLLPLATWPIALSGAAVPGARAVIMGLLGMNVVAAILTWFGRGWSRLGLTVVSYWVLFGWMFPLALRE